MRYHIYRKFSSDFGDKEGKIVYVEPWYYEAGAVRAAESMDDFYARHRLRVTHIIMVEKGHTLQPI